MSSLAEALPQEIERCQELLTAYKEIGPPGQFGAMMIKPVIKEGIDSLASGDLVRMLRAYKALKACS